MDFNKYQELALRTKDTNNTSEDNLICGGLGITGESGEVADIIKKVVYHNHELDRDSLIKELGDVLWYVSLIADSINCDLDTIAELNINKLIKRYPEGFDTDKSINREC